MPQPFTPSDCIHTPTSCPSDHESPPMPLHAPLPAPTRQARVTRQPTQYGNDTMYAASTANTHNDDNPTYARAMASPNSEHWRAAMKVEFDSLVSHSVGRLIPRPKSANLLGGMWRFKRKRNTSGNIMKYKARWVILGNHQIHAIDYFKTYASVGVKESLILFMLWPHPRILRCIHLISSLPS